jgi:hypothetical protein
MSADIYEYPHGTRPIFRIDGKYVYATTGLAGAPTYEISGAFWYALPRELNDPPECQVRDNLVYPYRPGSNAIYEIR